MEQGAETQSPCPDDEGELQAKDAGPDRAAAPSEAAAPADAAEAAAPVAAPNTAPTAEIVPVVYTDEVAEARARYHRRRAREAAKARQMQAARCRLSLCPKAAHLGTVWKAAVSVAVFLLRADGDHGEKMRGCAKGLDCIAKQNPRLLFFAVVCPDAWGYLNHDLWVGGAPINVVLISFEELLGELAQDLSLPTKQFHYLLHNMACPHGIELPVLTRHLLTACANFRGMLSRLEIGHLFFADTNDFWTPQAIQRMLVMQEPFLQLVDNIMGKKNPARVLGGGLCVKAPNLVAYAEALQEACNYLFKGCGLLDGRAFSAKFLKNLGAHPLVVRGTFTSPVNLKYRMFVDQVVQSFALFGCYTEIPVCWVPGGWAGPDGQFQWLRDLDIEVEGALRLLASGEALGQLLQECGQDMGAAEPKAAKQRAGCSKCRHPTALASVPEAAEPEAAEPKAAEPKAAKRGTGCSKCRFAGCYPPCPPPKAWWHHTSANLTPIWFD